MEGKNALEYQLPFTRITGIPTSLLLPRIYISRDPHPGNLLYVTEK
jgi:hypothetical protein